MRQVRGERGKVYARGMICGRQTDGIYTKLCIVVAYYLLFCFLFYMAIALCYNIAIVCLLLHDSIGISTTRTVVLGYILL